MRAAATGRLGEVGDRLDRELGRVDLGGRLPAWVTLVRLLHWLLLLAAVGGLAWWAVGAVQGTVGDQPQVAGLPLAALLGVGGLVLGLLLAIVGRGRVGGIARARAEEAEEGLRDVVRGVLAADVVVPVRAELASYAEFRRGIGQATA